MPPSRWVIVTCSKSNVSLVRRKRVLKSEYLRTDHVKLESPSILTKQFFFARSLGGGGAGPPRPPLSTPVVTRVLITSAMKNTATQIATHTAYV